MGFQHSFDSDDPRAGLWEVTGRVNRQTEKAILLDDGTIKAWLPRSKIVITETKNGLVEVAMPTWLAQEKGYV